jgi:signal transduction histidine kinase
VANLLDKALKYSAGGGEVLVGVRLVNGSVVVSVKDAGRGIDPADQPKLFQSFVRLGAASDVARGTGLGLFVCKGIAEAHGGRIGVESAGLGKGSTFWFSIPAANAPNPSPVAALVAA